MNLTQYGDIFYFYILLIALVPAFILGYCEKRIKYYGMIVSVFMIFVMLGGDKKQSISFIVFYLSEVILIYLYLYIRKNTESRILFHITILLSLAPLILSKISHRLSLGTLGFIGLSYVTFKVLQIIIEVYDGIIKEIKFVDLTYFIIFFPAFSSGPIDRLRRFNEDLNAKISRNEYLDDYFIPGIKKIVLGLGYKFIIGELIYTYWLSKIPVNITFANSLNYMYAYSLYLFFDFAGYSLFAVGTSYFLGVKTPINFNKPFISKDMKEFWSRWHMSLSFWFRDYIYSRFVLQARRKKYFKNRLTASHVAQVITMTIMGIWHGTKFFYLIYGLYQAFVLIGTDIYQRKSKFHKANKNKKWYQGISIFITFNIACFGLLLFSGYLYNK